jgi:hypothetical protein
LWEASARPSWRRFCAALSDCENVQRRYLLGLLRRNRATAYGREHGFARIGCVEDFQRRVPLTKYEDYAPFVDRIAAGEGGVLTRDDVLLFQPSSGSCSARKLVPYTRSVQREFQRGILPWIFALYANYPAVARGPMYWSISPPGQPGDTRYGRVRIGFDDDADYLGARRRSVFSRLSVVPPRVADLHDIRGFRNATLAALLAAPDLALISVWSPSFLTLLLDWYLDHGEEVFETLRRTYPDIAEGRIAQLRALDGPRSGVIEARSASEAMQNQASLAIRASKTLTHGEKSFFERTWPDLAVISCWTDGASAAEARRLREFFPTTAIQGKGLLATEACVSLPLAAGRGPVLAVRSHFFEFTTDDGRCLAAHEVEAGAEYSVVVTTGGGLYRYRLEDRVLVTGSLGTTPTLRFLGKAGHVCDRYGEKLHVRHVDRVLDALLAGTGRRFCLLAPDGGEAGPCYTLYLESSGALPADFARRLEHALRENPHYRLCAELGQLQPVRLFRVWRNGLRSYVTRLAARGLRQGDVKPECLSTLDGWSSCFEGEYDVEDCPWSARAT